MAFSPEVVAAGVSALGSLASNALNISGASKNLKKNVQANKSYQSWLMTQGPSQQMRGIKAAGISPALAGESGVGSSSMPSFSSQNPPPIDIAGSISGLLGALSQVKVNEQNAQTGKAQEENIKAQTKGQQLENASKQIDLENKEGRASEFNTKTIVRDPLTGDIITDVDKWSASHSGIIPEVEMYEEKGSEGRLEAQNVKGDYVAQKHEQRARISDAEAKQIEAKARESEARLKQAVADGQYNQKDVLQAIQRLPRSQYDQILKDIEYKGKLITWQDLNNERFRDSDFGKFVDKMMSGDLSFGDKLLAALTLLGYAFMNK